MATLQRHWILDTNVIISAALSAHNPPSRLLSLLLENEPFWFSPDTFEELSTRLMRPKFDRYVGRDERLKLLNDLSAAARWATPKASAPTFPSRDPDDNPFLLLAETVWRTCPLTILVSGDADLLSLSPAYEAEQATTTTSLRILTVAQALAQLQG